MDDLPMGPEDEVVSFDTLVTSVWQGFGLRTSSPSRTFMVST